MKLAMEIAIKAKEEFAWINADGYSDEELAETVDSLEQFIAAKLEPVREVLSRTKDVLQDPAVWNRITATKYGVASVFMDVTDTLALLSEEE